MAKFYGFNVPNLHLIEDSSPWIIPNLYEQTDALRSIAQIGSSVVRIYSFSIQGSQSDLYHVMAAPTTGNYTWSAIPNTQNPVLYANEDLFIALDNALMVAAATNVKLIIPLIDQYSWWGGIPAFCDLHNVSSASSFYTDAHIISNFNAFVLYVLNRTNTVTGSAYGNDTSIYAWETGNELFRTFDNGTITPVPAAWTTQLASTIKSTVIESQLVIDGSYSLIGWDEAIFLDSAVDGFTGHYYEMSAPQLVAYAATHNGTVTIVNTNIVAGTLVGGVFLVLLAILAVMFVRPSWLGIHTGGRSLYAHMYIPALPESEFVLELQDASKAKSTEESELESADEPELTPPKNARKKVYFHVGAAIATLLIALTAVVIGVKEGPTIISPTYAARFQSDYALIMSQSKKLFYVGEFGLSSYDQLSGLLTAVDSSNASGALIWSLRYHSRNGGFWNHADGNFQSYHLPGFSQNTSTGLIAPTSTGFGSDEAAVVQLVKVYTGNSAGKNNTLFGTVPQGKPTIFSPNKVTGAGGTVAYALRWTGSAGARNYTIERAIGLNGTDFNVIAEGISDAVEAGTTAFEDATAASGAVYTYRVIGLNNAGRGDYSDGVTAE
ncbi:hypothetical protein HDU83_004541 [Entophlyctis luteolus]|nr:hypothetical protein HDU83_004541 [Entophlyctis luteolus]